MSRNIVKSCDRGAGKRRGFSLVEILISIIILGLGLLGLGALFPVVIRQQRISTDQTLGVIVGESARSKLVSEVFADSGTWQLFGTVSENPPAQGWALGDGWNWQNPSSSGPQRYENGEWYVDREGSTGTVLELDASPDRGFRRGASWIGDPRRITTVAAGRDIIAPVPLVERIYPADSETPQFVWDFVAQRVSNDIRQDVPADPIRAALFVRRIDPRIRVPKGRTLRETLLAEGGVTPTDQRSPFGEDSQAQPTFDGTDGGAGNYVYSQIRSAPVEFYFQPSDPSKSFRDRLYVPSSVADNVYALMKQPNQKLVDNRGNIYTVITSGVEPGIGSGRYLKIEPPVPASIGAENSQEGLPDRIAIREVAFTPQIPVYVTTLEVAK